MKQAILQIFLILSVFPATAQYTVKGGNGVPLLAENDTRNKLEVYLLNGLSGAEITFTSETEGAHQWYQYTDKAIDAQAIPCNQTGKTSVITAIAGAQGYFVGEPTASATRFVWIIDYSNYLPLFYNLSFDDESEDRCKFLKIIMDVEAKPLPYYTPLGVQMNLKRTYHLQYTTRKWDEESKTFVPEAIDKVLTGVLAEEPVESPLQDTDFTLTGDDFAAHFGLAKKLTTPVYKAIAVEAHASTEQHKEAGENELIVSNTDLGGSVPVNIVFSAEANEPVAAFYIWKIDKIDSATGNRNTIVRYTDKTLSYNFEDSGDFEVQLEVMDSRSVCVDTTLFYTVNIGETELEVPNFFSPGTSIGSNDEFRVSYKSILSFQCSIFNRWGNLLYQWNDPAKGWDGRVGGRFVPTGAYIYVIEYKGTDGVMKTKKGTVNILRSKNQ
ncbi:MAG: gliding motility-associated C-terminal domain-containing protein [Dysgonamonadaceae bacterium]|jgi:gliding motility-associated-like protein|nr:gliding motility-associated C-terminal domain-containing protein [Dysgonamonadaceae bacterium]